MTIQCMVSEHIFRIEPNNKPVVLIVKPHGKILAPVTVESSQDGVIWEDRGEIENIDVTSQIENHFTLNVHPLDSYVKIINANHFTPVIRQGREL